MSVVLLPFTSGWRWNQGYPWNIQINLKEAKYVPRQGRWYMLMHVCSMRSIPLLSSPILRLRGVSCDTRKPFGPSCCLNFVWYVHLTQYGLKKCAEFRRQHFQLHKSWQQMPTCYSIWTFSLEEYFLSQFFHGSNVCFVKSLEEISWQHQLYWINASKVNRCY